MKKIFKYICLLVLPVTITLMPSCTDGFEDMNKSGQGIYDDDMLPDDNLVGAYFPGFQASVYFNYNYGAGTDWTFQLYQNLNSDMFSGYMSSPSFGVSSNLTYAMNDGWNSYAWTTSNGYTMANFMKMERKAKTYENLDVYTKWGKILKVAAMHRVADLYGPIIYSDYGKSDLGAAYDDVKTLYTQFFADLDEGIAGLEAYETANPENARFVRVDNIYGASMIQWVKFANSLRLKLAMNIVKADPAKAKEEAEKAINHKWGVLEAPSDIAKVSNMANPVATISNWGDCAMSADMESILKGYEDPRLEKYFLPATNPKIKGEYKGIRLGTGVDREIYANSSALNVTVSTPPVLLSPAEVYFLRAEGALRGWDMKGTAKELYEKGVTASFDQYGISGASTYLTSTALPAKYEDKIVPANSHDAVNLVTPAWVESDNNEVKLQKIMTQKWIAMFPDGSPAWTDYRRTGYPKLFPVVKNNSQGIVSTELGPRRLPFPSSEAVDNATNYADGVSKLGGADNAGTRLWWDVNKANF